MILYDNIKQFVLSFLLIIINASNNEIIMIIEYFYKSA